MLDYREFEKELIDLLERYDIRLNEYINMTPSDFEKEPKIMKHVLINRLFIVRQLKMNIYFGNEIKKQEVRIC